MRSSSPGLSTTVQDLGRPGYYHLGIPLSGGMDRLALARRQSARRQRRRRRGAGSGLHGAGARFTDDASVAVTGAELPPKVDGERARRWTSFTVKNGQVLSFDFLKKGARAYIAVSGGIDVPVVLGSRSTYALGALGGFEGRKLEAGDRAAGRRSGKRGARKAAGRAESSGAALPAPAELRVLPGLYWHRITEKSGRNFFEDVWKVAPEADRIGYRFRGGPAARIRASASSLSAPAPTRPTSSTPAIPTARSRCRAAREPIVLHRDAVSGGGY